MLHCLRKLPGVLVFILVGGAVAAETTQPNVLLIISDDLNMDLGAYGHPIAQTPHIDALASRGVRFTRAYAQYPVCAASRASMLTGLYPEQNGVVKNQDHLRDHSPKVTTLPQIFQANGYFTARAGKIFHYAVPGHIGTDGVDDPASWHEVVNPAGVDADPEVMAESEMVPGGLNYGAYLNWQSLQSEDSDHTDYGVASAAVRLMEEHHPDKTGQPFFIAVGFFRPHLPFIAPSSYFDLYPVEKMPLPVVRSGDRDDIPVAAQADRYGQAEMTDLHKRKAIQAYYATVSFMDAQVGRLLRALDDSRLAGNTIVVFMSDHGFHLGQHGFWQKGDLFEGSVRAPLIVSVPGMATGGRAAAGLAEYLDIHPTLLELAGLNGPDYVEGRSLVPMLEDPDAQHRDSVLSLSRSLARWTRKDYEALEIMGYSLRTGRYRYTEWNEGAAGVELYDYYNDVEEYNNLVDDPAYDEVRAELKSLLDERRMAARRRPESITD